MSTQKYIVLGGGPVGCTIALLLAKQGHQVDIYDFKDAAPVRTDESYSIGINPRSLHSFEMIDPELAQKIRDTGDIINAWHIYSGKRRVAAFESGTVYGHSRALSNNILLEWCGKFENIRVVWRHKLEKVDFIEKKLVFQNDDETVTIDAGEARIIACDGVWSTARRDMEAHIPEVRTQMDPWFLKYRSLFSKPGATAPGMDPSVHYPMKGVYVCTVDDRRWSIGIGIRDGALDQAFLESDDASPENISRLKAFLAERAPLAAPLVDDEDCRQFFSRRIFKGSIVKVDRLNAGEWLVLLGDAAHAVLPPTGEGFNSGCEDCSVLAEILQRNTTDPFEEYNRERLPDLHGLNKLARYLNDGTGATGFEQAARVMTTIYQGIAFKKTYADLTFGKDAPLRTKYRDVIALWEGQQRVLPVMKAIVAPFAAIASLFSRK